MALRSLIGEALRQRRVGQGRTLRQVSADARVSLGYISEIERGQKEASSEMLAALCGALRVPMSAVLREVSDRLLVEETRAARAQERVLTLASAPASPARPEPHGGDVVAAA
ncbi:MAG: helix-turn-helix domain-containing protein [Actinomycetota bacterium]|nr:helix-turn-helix domain-containing protein [Actinomycetota bacterium]